MIVSGISLGFVYNGNEYMNCKKYLKISVITDNLVSILLTIKHMYELTQSEDYVFLERAALRILKRDEEKIDEIMVNMFGWPKVKSYTYWNKSKGDLISAKKSSAKINQNEEGLYEIENVFTPRQQDYIKDCMKENVTVTEADLEEDLMLNLDCDIYCCTFVRFIMSNDAILHRELMLKCALTYSF